MMRSGGLVFVLSVAWLLVGAVGKVLVLTPDDFDSTIDGSLPALVEFYAPWCGHCRKLEPIYEKLGSVYHPHKDKVIIAKVNGDEHRSLGQRFDIKGFPTIFWFPEGETKPEKYNGGRTLKDLATFVEKKTGITVHVKGDVSYATILDSSRFKQIAADPKKALFVLIHNTRCAPCEAFEPAFQSLAKALGSDESLIVAKLNIEKNDDLLDEIEFVGKPIFRFFPKGPNKKSVDFDGNPSMVKFIEFLNKHAGLKRNLDGSIADSEGVIPEFDEIIKLFFKSEKKKGEKLVKKGTPQGPTAYYVKVMEKISSEGTEFIQKEIDRLTRVIKAGDDTSTAKIDEFKIRINILKQFAAVAEAISSDQKEPALEL